MDPFAILPFELAVQVLLLVERDVSLRPAYLGAALLVSRQWNAVASHSALWTELDLSPDISVEEEKRRLRRAKGSLRRLRMCGGPCVAGRRVFSSPLWQGELQEACAREALVDVALKCYYPDESFVPDMIIPIADVVGSSRLTRLSIKARNTTEMQSLIHKILQRSFHLRNLELDVENLYEVLYPQRSPRLFAVENEDWLPNLSGTDDKGLRPLEKLETLQISLWSPLLWEHLSGLGVNLGGVSLRSYAYSFRGFQDQDPSGRVLQHVLDVIGGPLLRDFEFSEHLNPMHPEIEAVVFKHPRRSVKMHLWKHQQTEAAGGIVLDPGPMLGTLEELVFDQYLSGVVKVFPLFFKSIAPCLSRLSLRSIFAEDEILANAIRCVGGSIKTLEIINWSANDALADQTLTAIGNARSLRCLKLLNCEGVTYTMLEPLLLGVHPDKPPLCPVIREAFCRHLRGDASEFLERLRESIKQRFPYDGIVNEKRVCSPWMQEERNLL